MKKLLKTSLIKHALSSPINRTRILGKNRTLGTIIYDF